HFVIIAGSRWPEFYFLSVDPSVFAARARVADSVTGQRAGVLGLRARRLPCFRRIPTALGVRIEIQPVTVEFERTRLPSRDLCRVRWLFLEKRRPMHSPIVLREFDRQLLCKEFVPIEPLAFRFYQHAGSKLVCVESTLACSVFAEHV